MSTTFFDYRAAREADTDTATADALAAVVGRSAVYTTGSQERMIGTVEAPTTWSSHYPIIRFADGRWARTDDLIELVDVDDEWVRVGTDDAPDMSEEFAAEEQAARDAEREAFDAAAAAEAAEALATEAEEALLAAQTAHRLTRESADLAHRESAAAHHRMARPVNVESRTCDACSTTVEAAPGIGWVDARSGDDGGTFDQCPDSADGHHAAAHVHVAGRDGVTCTVCGERTEYRWARGGHCYAWRSDLR